MKTTLVRTAVSGGALALTLGVAGPALACVSGDVSGAIPATFTSDRSKADHSKTKGASTESLAEVQARLDAWLAAKLDRLVRVRDRVAASTTLTDAQKAELLARIDARTANLAALRAQVAAATSIGEVKAALQAAISGLGRHGGWGWAKGWHGGSHHQRWGHGPSAWSSDDTWTHSVSVSWGSGRDQGSPDHKGWDGSSRGHHNGHHNGHHRGHSHGSRSHGHG